MSDLGKPKLHGNDAPLIAVTVVFGVLVTASVVLRFAIKIRTRAKVTCDDWLCLGSYVGWLGYLASLVWGIVRGINGVALFDYPYPILLEFMKIGYTIPISAGISFTLSRFSVLWLYYHLFPSKNFRVAVWIVGSANLIYGLAALGVNIFRCTPISAAFDPFRQTQCIDFLRFFLIMEPIVIVIDLAVVLIPLLVVRSLNLLAKQKIQLSIVFAMGLFATLISAVRLAKTGTNLLKFVSVESAIWFFAQISLALICVSAPVYGTLMGSANRRVSRWRESRDSRRRSKPSRMNSETGLVVDSAGSGHRSYGGAGTHSSRSLSSVGGSSIAEPEKCLDVVV